MTKPATQVLDRISPERHSGWDNTIPPCGQKRHGQSRGGNTRLAWYVARAPFMSLFISNIPRGRTGRQMEPGPVIQTSPGYGLCIYEDREATHESH